MCQSAGVRLPILNTPFSTEKTGKLGHQRDTDERDTAARHQLLHPLRLGTG